MTKARPLYALLIEFEKPEQVLEAARRVWDAGYRQTDAFTPYPVEGLATALGMKRSRIPAVVFCGAVVGGLAGYLMQYFSMVVDYPLNVGGRPLNSWPAYITITFEVLILVASLSGFLAMLFLNGLPKPNHPVFNAPGFERASQDRFFLCIEADDPQFDLDRTGRLLAELAPMGVVIEVFDEELTLPEEDVIAYQPTLRPEQAEPATQSGGRDL